MPSSDTEPWKQEEWLYREYVEKGRPTTDIAADFDVNPGAISYWLKKLDIGTRSKSEAVSNGDVGKLKDETWLREKYVDEELSTVEIGEMLNVSKSTVRKYIEKHGIETRPAPSERSEADFEKLNNPLYLQKRYHEDGLTIEELASELNTYQTTILERFERFEIDTRKGGVQDYDERINSAEYLHKEYVENEKTIEQIAEACNCSNWLVHRRLKENDIDIRSSGVEKGRRMLSVSLAQAKGDIEQLQDKEWLQQQYSEKEKSTTEIAQELGLNPVTVFQYLKRHGIKTRDRVEALPSGESHHFYKENSTGYFGPNWDEQKLKARIRDHAQCQVCGKTDAEHIDEYGCVNSAHHIKPRSEFVEDGRVNYERANRLENLITLCTDHHPKLEGIPIDNRS